MRLGLIVQAAQNTPDTSGAIIASAAITASVALVGVAATVIVGVRQQRKTLEAAAEQARLARDVDERREARAAAHRRYERVRAILEPHVALAREMRGTTQGWMVIIGPQSLEDRIRQILERVDAVWQVAEQRRGDFEVEPGLDELRAIFGRMIGAYNVFTHVASDRSPGTQWQAFALAKTQEVQTEADTFTYAARALIARLEAETA